jgi:hypothetical protein
MVPIVVNSLSLISLHQHHHFLELLSSVLRLCLELVDQEFFSDLDSLLVDDVVKFGVFGVEDLLLIVILLVIFIFIVDVIFALVGVDALGAVLVVPIWLVIVGVELLKDVLDLSLELLVTLLHEVLKHLWHSELFCLFSQLLTRED